MGILNFRPQYLLVLLCTISLQLFPQDKKIKFGTCTNDEMNISGCSFDTAAEAVMIYDIGNCPIVSYDRFFERTFKMKILTKAGIKHAEFSINFVKGVHRITKLKANTYNLVDNKIVTTAFDPKNYYDEQDFEDHYIRKFALPDVKEGSVIEVTYSINNLSQLSLPSWVFQDEVPVLYSEYSCMYHPYYNYVHFVRGEGVLSDFTREYDNTIPYSVGIRKLYPETLKFVMTDIPAFKDETFIPSKSDYVMKVDFQLTGIMQNNGSYKDFLTTWPKLNEELLDNESFGDYIKSCSREAKDILSNADFISKTPLEKAEWIDKYLKSTYKYNGIKSYLANDRLSQVKKDKAGTSAELNLLATGFMREAGFNAKAILLSTREHGKILEAYPFREAFNYVVCLVDVDSTLYLMDVTEPLLRFGSVPPQCLVDEGLIVQKELVEWIDIESTAMSENKYEIELIPDPVNDSLSESYTLTSSMYEALEKRKAYRNDYQDLASKLLGENYLSYDSVKCSGLNDPVNPFILTYKKQTELEKVGEKIIIDPFCGMAITENPLKHPSRKYPIDFTFKWARTFSVNITIPEGYKLASKPENMVVNDKRARIVYSINDQEPTKINIVGVYQFKNDVYPAADYNLLKELYNKIISKFNEKIILEPTSL